MTPAADKRRLSPARPWAGLGSRERYCAVVARWTPYMPARRRVLGRAIGVDLVLDEHAPEHDNGRTPDEEGPGRETKLPPWEGRR